MKIEELDLGVRQFNMLKRAGIDTTEDFINYPDKERLKKLTGRTYGVMEELLKVGNVSDDEISAPAPAQTETAVVFDYSELDTDTAEQLGKISENVLNIKKKYIFDMAEQVKKAHDLLANCKNGLFGAWCMSIGISRDTGNNLVNIAETFGNISAEEQKNLSQLKPSLLYEAARSSAPVELVEAVKNGDITTHKEYIALKKQLEEANNQLEQQKINNQRLSDSNDRIYAASKRNFEDYDKERLKALELQKRIEELECEADEADREYAAMADREDQHETLIADLKRQINELESRPVEVAVEQDTAALAEKDKQISELKEEIERLSDNSVKSFVIKLTIEEYVQLQDIVKSSDNHCIVNAVNSARMIKL